MAAFIDRTALGLLGATGYYLFFLNAWAAYRWPAGWPLPAQR